MVAGAASPATLCRSSGTGSAAAIDALGCHAIGEGVLPLRASPVPNTTGAFFYGASQAQTPFGNGTRCVGGVVYRLAYHQIVGGELTTELDYANPPQSGGQILAGSTWNFQAYFRDPQGGGAQINLSDGLQVTFVP